MQPKSKYWNKYIVYTDGIFINQPWLSVSFVLCNRSPSTLLNIMFPKIPSGFSINLNFAILLSSLNYRSDHKLIRKYPALFCASPFLVLCFCKYFAVWTCRSLISLMWQCAEFIFGSVGKKKEIASSNP